MFNDTMTLDVKDWVPSAHDEVAPVQFLSGPICIADVNKDGKVGFIDLFEVLKDFGGSGCPCDGFAVALRRHSMG